MPTIANNIIVIIANNRINTSNESKKLVRRATALAVSIRGSIASLGILSQFAP